MSTDLRGITGRFSPGDHILYVYSEARDKHNFLCEYFRSGLEKGEDGIYVAGEETPDQIRSAMRSQGIDVEGYEASNRLRILSYDGLYLQDGKANPALILEKWGKAISRFKASKIRAMSETACFYRHDQVDGLLEYERLLGRMLRTPVTAICCYNLGDIATREYTHLLEVIEAHGYILYNTSKTGFAAAVELRRDFEESVNDMLEEVLGKTAKRVLLDHLAKKGIGKNVALEEPRTFLSGMEAVLGSGGRVLVNEILRKVYSKMGVSLPRPRI